MDGSSIKEFSSSPTWIDLYSIIEVIAANVRVPNEWRKRIRESAFARLPDLNFDPWQNRLYRNQAWQFAQDMRMAYRFWQAIAICRCDLIQGDGLQLRERIDGDGNVDAANADDHGDALQLIDAIEGIARHQIGVYLAHSATIIPHLASKLIHGTLPPLLTGEDVMWLRQQLFDRDIVIAALSRARVPYQRLLDTTVDTSVIDNTGSGNRSLRGFLHDEHIRAHERTQLDARITELCAIPPMLGDFISLDNVVEQIGLGIELTDGQVDAYLPLIGNIRPSIEEHPFRRMLREWPVRVALQKSQAASLLLDNLFNDREVRRPPWVEISAFDGIQVMNDAVAMEGRKELEGIGASTRKYLTQLRGDASFSTRHWRQGEEADAKKPFHELDISVHARADVQVTSSLQLMLNPRIRSIGFYRTDLARFLNEVGIRHQIRLRNVDVESDLEPDDNRASELTRQLREIPKKQLSDGLSTSDLASALFDTDDCQFKTGRDKAGWLAYLQGSPPKWATDPKSGIRLHVGAPGRADTSYWHPLKFAGAAVLNFRRAGQVKREKHEFFLAINERFRKVAQLSPWRDDWDVWVADVYKPMRAKEQFEKPGK